jgi:hypothetical protein
MAQKKFLFSVADCYFYKTGTNDLIFKSQTLIDSSIEATVSNEDARAGKGNTLQFIYYHTSEFNVNLTEQQFDLQKLAPSIGSNIVTGGIIQVEETVTLGAGGTGTVTLGTPVNDQFVISDTVKGTVAIGESDTTIEFTGSDFAVAGGAQGDKVCVIYSILDPAARTITVNANMIPSVGRLVMKAQLGSSESGFAEGSSVIGEVVIEVPTLQLSPAGASLTMSSSGISQSALSGRALAYTSSEGCCTTSPIYATITERIYGASQYDSAKAMVATNSDITVAPLGVETVDLLLIPNYVGAPFAPDYADVSFTSDDPAVATVGLHTGIVTGVAAGNCTITATVTGYTNLTATAYVEVTA